MGDAADRDYFRGKEAHEMADWVNDDYPGEDDFDDSQEMVPFKVKRCEHETAAAWLLVLEGGEKDWFPKSRCDFDPATMILEVPRWLVSRKGLVEK